MYMQPVRALGTYQELSKYLSIFQPVYARRLERTKLDKMRFAYYTSAGTGINILKGKALWMRAAACMNDYREIDYGIQLLNKTIYSSDARRLRLQRLAHDLEWGDNILEIMLSDLNRNEQNYINHTYLACVSEHRSRERGKGRLSMWRAYGRKTGVAFIWKPQEIFRPILPLPLMLAPVEYLNQEQFTESFDVMLKNIEENMDFLHQDEPAKVLEYYVKMLMISLFSIKNPGFNEEREWRFIYHETTSQKLPHDFAVVDSVPQVIYKLPLLAPGDEGEGVPLAEALEGIIIGPSQFADVIRIAFIRLLDEMGIPNAEDRVTKSNIPLRTNLD